MGEEGKLEESPQGSDFRGKERQGGARRLGRENAGAEGSTRWSLVKIFCCFFLSFFYFFLSPLYILVCFTFSVVHNINVQGDRGSHLGYIGRRLEAFASSLSAFLTTCRKSSGKKTIKG